jgi:hypothetical protein
MLVAALLERGSARGGTGGEPKGHEVARLILQRRVDAPVIVVEAARQPLGQQALRVG